MNEAIFLLHILTVMTLTLFALRMGKEWMLSWSAIQSVLANLFIQKQVELFGLTVTCCDVFIIGLVLTLNLAQEYHGKNFAKRMLWSNFFILISTLILGMFQIAYTPSPADEMNGAYLELLSPTPRIIFSSIAIYLLVQRLDIFLYDLLRKRFDDRYLAFRNIISISTTQLIDTILFSCIALYGIVDSVAHIIFVSYIIKLIVIFLSTPFIRFSKYFIYGKETIKIA